VAHQHSQNNTIFWDASSFGLVDIRHRLGRTCAINFGVEEQANKNSYLHASCFLPGLSFDPED
jgi:hypothetical protein